MKKEELKQIIKEEIEAVMQDENLMLEINIKQAFQKAKQFIGSKLEGMLEKYLPKLVKKIPTAALDKIETFMKKPGAVDQLAGELESAGITEALDKAEIKDKVGTVLSKFGLSAGILGGILAIIIAAASVAKGGDAAAMSALPYVIAAVFGGILNLTGRSLETV